MLRFVVLLASYLQAVYFLRLAGDPDLRCVIMALLLKLVLHHSFHSSVALIARSNRVLSTPRGSLTQTSVSSWPN
jgi:hypothetical protein